MAVTLRGAGLMTARLSRRRVPWVCSRAWRWPRKHLINQPIAFFVFYSWSQRITDGLPKFKDLPKEAGGSRDILPEFA